MMRQQKNYRVTAGQCILPFTNGVTDLFILVSASNDLSSSDSSGSSGSDETDLLSSAGSPPDGGGLANVLMVTTTVGMLHGVHGNSTNLDRTKQSDTFS